jgi:hypothetical protein
MSAEFTDEQVVRFTELATAPDADGHVGWKGRRSTDGGTPTIRTYGAGGQKDVGAARVAFWVRTGRMPVGRVIADCGQTHCVAPGHVMDKAERDAERLQLRRIQGMAEREPTCRKGHDQRIHGTYNSIGKSICQTCQTERRAKHIAVHGRKRYNKGSK